MHRTESDHGLAQILQLLPSEGEFCSVAKRHKLRENPLPIQELEQELEHRSRLMKLFFHAHDAQMQMAELVMHLSDPGMANWDKVESLAIHELFELKSFLYHYLALKTFLEKHKLQSLHPLPELSGLFRLLDPENNGLPLFRLSPAYSPKLHKLDEERLSCAHKLHEIRFADLEKAKKTLKLPTLKEDFILSRNQEARIQLLLNSKYYVISAESLANISFRLADSSAALKLKNKLNKLQQDIHSEEQVILQQLTQAIQNQLPELKQARSSTIDLVWDYMLAAYGEKYNCCIPAVYDPQHQYRGIKLKAAVNLPLKLVLEEQHRLYQPLDLDFKDHISLITGPNMGGKSTTLKTIALFCACAAKGIPVPADKALLPVFDHIYYNHAGDDHSETLSSFGREVVAFNTALHHGESTLFLLDEFAKGTNPEEGEALSLATIQYLQDMGFTLIAATHFSAPTKLNGIAHYSIRGISAKDFTRLKKLPKDNLQNMLKLLSEAMDYALIKLPAGQNPPQCAAQIAALLGLPPEILATADKFRKKDQ